MLPAWYCVRTQPKHEHIACATLSRNLGLDVFHPRLKMERPTQRGLVRCVESVFPCYIFVYCELDAYIDKIRYSTGVGGVVHFGDSIPCIPDNVINDLRSCFEAEEPMSVQDRLYPGAEVLMAQGPLLGTRAIVLQMLPAKKRVQILLDFLGRPTVAEVERNDVTVENSCLADLIPTLAHQRRACVGSAR